MMNFIHTASWTAIGRTILAFCAVCSLAPFATVSAQDAWKRFLKSRAERRWRKFLRTARIVRGPSPHCLRGIDYRTQQLRTMRNYIQ